MACRSAYFRSNLPGLNLFDAPPSLGVLAGEGIPAGSQTSLVPPLQGRYRFGTKGTRDNRKYLANLTFVCKAVLILMQAGKQKMPATGILLHFKQYIFSNGDCLNVFAVYIHHCLTEFLAVPWQDQSLHCLFSNFTISKKQ